MNVALFTRAWIEIDYIHNKYTRQRSPFSRGRGLKFISQYLFNVNIKVALFTRAWIEICVGFFHAIIVYVALFTRAWIEICYGMCVSRLNLSPFSRGRGLKLCLQLEMIYVCFVALFTRAWIEIKAVTSVAHQSECRPFHEGVD